MHDPDDLTMYTIYRDPTDIPGAAFVVRCWNVLPGGPIDGGLLGEAATLKDARLLVPGFADACLNRDVGDDPAIVETWIQIMYTERGLVRLTKAELVELAGLLSLDIDPVDTRMDIIDIILDDQAVNGIRGTIDAAFTQGDAPGTAEPDDCIAHAVRVLVEDAPTGRTPWADYIQITNGAINAYHLTRCCALHSTHSTPHVDCVAQ